MLGSSQSVSRGGSTALYPVPRPLIAMAKTRPRSPPGVAHSSGRPSATIARSSVTSSPRVAQEINVGPRDRFGELLGGGEVVEPSSPRKRWTADRGSSKGESDCRAGPSCPEARERTTILPPRATARRAFAIPAATSSTPPGRSWATRARDHEVGSTTRLELPELVDRSDTLSTHAFLRARDDLQNARGARENAQLKLAAQEPAHFFRLVDDRSVGGRSKGLGITHAGKKRRPGSAIGRLPREAQTPHRQHEVGVGEIPIEINPATRARRGEIGDLIAVVGVVNRDFDRIEDLGGKRSALARHGDANGLAFDPRRV